MALSTSGPSISFQISPIINIIIVLDAPHRDFEGNKFALMQQWSMKLKQELNAPEIQVLNIRRGSIILDVAISPDSTIRLCRNKPKQLVGYPLKQLMLPPSLLLPAGSNNPLALTEKDVDTHLVLFKDPLPVPNQLQLSYQPAVLEQLQSSGNKPNSAKPKSADEIIYESLFDNVSIIDENNSSSDDDSKEWSISTIVSTSEILSPWKFYPSSLKLSVKLPPQLYNSRYSISDMKSMLNSMFSIVFDGVQEEILPENAHQLVLKGGSFSGCTFNIPPEIIIGVPANSPRVVYMQHICYQLVFYVLIANCLPENRHWLRNFPNAWLIHALSLALVGYTLFRASFVCQKDEMQPGQYFLQLFPLMGNYLNLVEWFRDSEETLRLHSILGSLDSESVKPFSAAIFSRYLPENRSNFWNAIKLLGTKASAVLHLPFGEFMEAWQTEADPDVKQFIVKLQTSLQKMKEQNLH